MQMGWGQASEPIKVTEVHNRSGPACAAQVMHGELWRITDLLVRNKRGMAWMMASRIAVLLLPTSCFTEHVPIAGQS